MTLNFPASPTEGQIFTPSSGPSYIFRSPVWAIIPPNPRNRLINGAMMISQENGDTASSTVTSGVHYIADQWITAWGLTGTMNTQRGRSSDTGSDYANINIVTTTASPAAGAYLQIVQFIEGARTKDFLWGTAAARQAILRFNFFASVAGTYTAFLKNSANTRTFLAAFVAPANAWKVHTIVVPGETTGVWPTTTAKGVELGFGFAAGTTYGGGVAGWQSGNKIAITGSTNGAAATGSFRVTDVGLYLDTANAGVAPVWEPPDETQELMACQRYYRSYGGSVNFEAMATGQCIATDAAHIVFTFNPPMRIAPAASMAGVASTAAMYNSASGLVVLTAIPSTYNASPQSVQLFCTAASGLTAGHATILVTNNNLTTRLRFSARLV